MGSERILHRLGLMRLLKRSFRTTNCIENVNSLTADLTRKVKRWTNSPQRQRWLAAALLDIEPRLLSDTRIQAPGDTSPGSQEGSQT